MNPKETAYVKLQQAQDIQSKFLDPLAGCGFYVNTFGTTNIPFFFKKETD